MKQGCPDCDPSGTRRGKWIMYAGSMFFVLVCPYCKFEIRIHRACTVCGARSIPLCKHGVKHATDDPNEIFHTQNEFSTVPTTGMGTEVDYGTID